MIKATKISKSFGEKKVLSELEIEIHQGRITVIEGASGSGKTTLLRCLSLLDYPDEGSIEIDDLIYDFPLNKVVQNQYPKVTVVFQQFFLWPHLTNRDNITLAVKNRNGDCKAWWWKLVWGSRITTKNRKVNYKDKLDELIKYLNMEDFIDNFPNQSSVGQKQRVALARALILDPEYIFFDDITSALDIEQIEHVINLLLDLKEKNIGIFFITHNKDVAGKIADTTLYLKDGKMVRMK